MTNNYISLCYTVLIASVVFIMSTKGKRKIGYPPAVGKDDRDVPRVDERWLHPKKASVINLGIKQERAKEYPLIDYDVYYTNTYPCIMAHKNDDNVHKLIIKANRKGDKLCVPICPDCLSELLFSLRVVNEKNVYRIYDNHLSVKYLHTFAKGEYCYFCGFSDGGCYDVRLNTVAFHMCSHCRERAIIQLKKLCKNKTAANL